VKTIRIFSSRVQLVLKYSRLHGGGQFQTSMERRRQKRYVRRILVSFWVDGGSREYKGYTTTVSRSGIFIATSHLPARGSQVRLSMTHKGGTATIEGKVVRVKQVPIALRQVQQAGFGLSLTGGVDALVAILPELAENQP
jgi:hypothetical protein